MKSLEKNLSLSVHKYSFGSYCLLVRLAWSTDTAIVNPYVTPVSRHHNLFICENDSGKLPVVLQAKDYLHADHITLGNEKNSSVSRWSTLARCDNSKKEMFIDGEALFNDSSLWRLVQCVVYPACPERC